MKEKKVFGCHLKEYNVELKGRKLLQKETFKRADNYTEELLLDKRQKHIRRFLTAGLGKRPLQEKIFTPMVRLGSSSCKERWRSCVNMKWNFLQQPYLEAFKSPKDMPRKAICEKTWYSCLSATLNSLKDNTQMDCSFWTVRKKYSTANLQNRFTTISSGRIKPTYCPGTSFCGFRKQLLYRAGGPVHLPAELGVQEKLFREYPEWRTERRTRNPLYPPFRRNGLLLRSSQQTKKNL